MGARGGAGGGGGGVGAPDPVGKETTTTGIGVADEPGPIMGPDAGGFGITGRGVAMREGDKVGADDDAVEVVPRCNSRKCARLSCSA